jgi:hypothetical protein
VEFDLLIVKFGIENKFWFIICDGAGAIGTTFVAAAAVIEAIVFGFLLIFVVNASSFLTAILDVPFDDFIC